METSVEPVCDIGTQFLIATIVHWSTSRSDVLLPHCSELTRINRNLNECECGSEQNHQEVCVVEQCCVVDYILAVSKVSPNQTFPLSHEA